MRSIVIIVQHSFPVTYGCIFTSKLEAQLGKVVKCVVEEYNPYSDSYSGRTWMDAPEIDSGISFVSEKELGIGEAVDILITSTDEYDLIGTADF